MSKPIKPANQGLSAQPLHATVALLVTCYSLFSWCACQIHSPDLGSIACGSFILAVLLNPLRQRRLWAWVAALGVVTLLSIVRQWSQVQVLLAIPSATIWAWVFFVFYRSLSLHRTPLITQIVQALFAQVGWKLLPSHIHYTRKVTWVWTCVLGFLVVLHALRLISQAMQSVCEMQQRCLVSPLSGWPMQPLLNAVTAIAFVGLFVGEYLVRQHQFQHHPYRNFWGFLRQMASLGPRFWAELLR